LGRCLTAAGTTLGLGLGRQCLIIVPDQTRPHFISLAREKQTKPATAAAAAAARPRGEKRGGKETRRRKRTGMASTFSFPELTPAQIAEALNGYDLAPDGPLRADDIANPHPDLFAAILSLLLANVTGYAPTPPYPALPFQLPDAARLTTPSPVDGRFCFAATTPTTR